MLRYLYGALLMVLAGYLHAGRHYYQAAVFAIVSIYVLGSLLKEEIDKI